MSKRRFVLMLYILIIIFINVTFSIKSYAHNVKIDNTTLLEQDSTSKTINIKFDISWENSWRNAINYDAIWIFVKYSKDSGATWNHAILKTAGTNPAGFSSGTGTGVDIVVPSDKIGCFVRRSLVGSGTVDVKDMKLVWDWSANGLTITDQVRVKVFGIEMVYIPQGTFYAGDNGMSTASLKQGSADSSPWFIQSESAISVQNVTTGGYYYVSAGNSGEDVNGAVFNISSSFPKGYNSFYVMKYEISQEQYRDFINTISYSQQLNRVSAVSAGKFMCADDTQSSPQSRNGIKCQIAPLDPNSGVYQSDLSNENSYNGLADGQHIACNYLSWMDLCAYADWAGLRPITELEHEKVCRGKFSTNNGEYAWGSTNLDAATTALSNSGAEAESPNQGNCNYSACSPDGPYRCGSYANATSSRTSAGAGYYGAMDLSGNVWERCVTIGNQKGRSFSGTNGDGELSVNGNATNADWPGNDGKNPAEIVDASGSGFRGGSWNDGQSLLAISSREKAAMNDSMRSNTGGGRCGRTSP